MSMIRRQCSRLQPFRLSRPQHHGRAGFHGSGGMEHFPHPHPPPPASVTLISLCPRGCVYTKELTKYFFNRSARFHTCPTPTENRQPHPNSGKGETQSQSSFPLVLSHRRSLRPNLISFPNVQRLQFMGTGTNTDSSCSRVHVHTCACTCEDPADRH